jgi:hypothetical protein
MHAPVNKEEFMRWGLPRSLQGQSTASLAPQHRQSLDYLNKIRFSGKPAAHKSQPVGQTYGLLDYQ